MKRFNITLLPGDGIGPEVTQVAREVLDAVSVQFDVEFKFDVAAIGGVAIDEHGSPLPEATLQSCQNADAALLGAVGGPRWETHELRPERGLLQLRQALRVFANVRPLRVQKALIDCGPIKREILEDVDLVIYRELTGGAYFGKKHLTATTASDECAYCEAEIERIAHKAFQAARRRRGKVTSVDKANVLATSKLWRDVVTRLHLRHYGDVTLEHALVDATAMQLISAPRSFDVILTDNLFGDILSDEASMLGGSIGLAPSASLGESGPGLFEPVHGSAPDIAGRDMANPIGAVLSAAMMLRLGLALPDAADAVEDAVESVLSAGLRTKDLGGELGCRAMGQAIVAALTRTGAGHHLQMHWA